MNDAYEQLDSLRAIEYQEAVVEKEEEEIEINLPINKDNVVNSDKLRQIQNITLSHTKDFLSRTFGPMGSNTKIIKGNTQQDISSVYSKDGLKVLSNIINSGPIEASIVDELISVTRAVEKEVGDGTTSTVILSSLIFNNLMKIEKKYNVPPFQLCRLFQSIVDEIKELIDDNGRECTVDDIYNIAMISTNGNEEVSTNIKNIYEQYGMNVELSVGISNDSNSVVKVYDGLTITEGMSDPAFINNRANNTAEIHDAHVYHFADPIDSMDMVALFEAILTHNIYEPLQNEEAPIPTVITCPKLTADLSATIKMLIQQLYQFDGNSAESAKPPIVIITNVVASDEIIMDDIANLCGCKTIRKYISPDIYKADVEKGVAATVDTVVDFAGHAELVVADDKKTKFINPQHMLKDEDDEPSQVYSTLIKFLETELEQSKGDSNANDIGLLKKRLNALKSNMVDYLVGGVTIADRDMTKDLVEDAVKNCKSASLYGIGYAANFEGLCASYATACNYINNMEAPDIKKDIAKCIFNAYCEVSEILYGTVEFDKDIVKDAVYKSILNGKPYNIATGILNVDDATSGDNVLCSIKLDINILDTLSKIITMMATCNQCLLQASNLNIY